MKVTVIVPVYNAANYLCKCLDSIANQTYSDFELLLIDDGSKDESGKICDEYAARDERIKVVHKTNAGVSTARNTGIKLAKGEWICFVDSDDYVATNYLECMISAVNRDNSDICIQGLIHVRDDKKISTFGFETQSVFLREITCDLFYRTILHRGPYCKLLRLSTIFDNNCFFPENISFGEDAIFYYKYLQHCDKLSFVEECGYYYVQHEGVTLSTKVHHPEELAFHIKNRYSLTMQLAHKIDSKIVFPDEFYQIKVNELKILISSALTQGYSLTECRDIVKGIIHDPDFDLPAIHPTAKKDVVFLFFLKKGYLFLYFLLKQMWFIRINK